MTLLYRVLKRIIRNDKFALDPPEIYNGRVFALAAAVSDSAPLEAVENREPATDHVLLTRPALEGLSLGITCPRLVRGMASGANQLSAWTQVSLVVS